MRQIIPLNFNWFFAPYDEKHETKRNLDEFEKVNLPHNAVDMPFNHFNEKMIETVSSYVFNLNIEKSWEEEIIRLKT